MTYNVTKLDAELKAAGIPIASVSGSKAARIDFAPEATAEQRALAEQIKAAHDPAPTRAQRLAKIGMTEEQAARTLVAVQGPNAPRWATDALAAEAARIDGALR